MPPGKAGSLSEQQYSQVATFLRQANGLPPANGVNGQPAAAPALTKPPAAHIRATIDVPTEQARRLVGGAQNLKPAKIAIMRKLIVTANALLKAERCWQQSPT